MCLGTGIPPEKLDHPLFRKWLSKYTDINGCRIFSKLNIVRLNHGMQHAIMQLLAGKPLAVLFDEWTDSRGCAVLAGIVRSFKLNVRHVQPGCPSTDSC